MQSETAAKLELWFFRDMLESNRLRLFELFGFNASEMDKMEKQRMVFRRILAALSAAEPVKTDCEFCKGSGVEFILAGHGNINEEPCSTCGGTGKEGRHSICRDCDEIQAVHKPFAFNVCVEGWGEELMYTEDGARSLIARLRRTKGQDGKATITPLYAPSLSATEPTVAVKVLEWVAMTSAREDGPAEPTGDWEASCMLGEYSVCFDPDQDMSEAPWCVWSPNENIGHYPDIDEAKAAAQADYEARIRSALTAQVQDVAGTVEAFDRDHPELYWHIAKGKITAGEPLYGAIITDLRGTELGHGESDVSAVGAFNIAVSAALPAAPAKQDGQP